MQVNNFEVLFERTLQASNLSEKQQAVLRASLTLFAEQGFDKTSTGEIAKQAGVSEGTVFKQFKTKKGILEALMKPFVAEIIPLAITEFVTEIDSNQFNDFRQFVTYVSRDRMDFALANQKQVKIFIQEMSRDPKIIQTMAARLQQLLTGDLGQLFNKFQESGQLVDWPLPRIGRYIASTIASYIAPQLLGVSTDFDTEQASQEAAEFLVRGLTPVKG
ncbi:TetR/AcrR family transcriptional regulator [Lactobacillus sp. CBA3605]|uniref:TetR/AcrR family transcriptional regulator n=1 Tax=Lactobacillus sp. CBA3605 TaxID=2099788 RepID=UPI000CFB0DAE|nr:TetR/AcrR family transcriptional regulator [Lactobacillus sp. CBA3605]AVK62346.1 TetR/AcrR family transcriptional regulator [Lactobacillus sp. CBA3605]